LEGGPPSFTPGLSYRALLRNTASMAPWSSATGLSPSRAPHSKGLRLTDAIDPAGPTTPIPQGDRFRLGPVRSPLLRPSRLISLPRGTEMFQFPRFALVRKRVTALTDSRVAPFGHLGINACVPLPQAYRSLPRPSSPPCAQASPTCLHSLDYNQSIQAERLQSFQPCSRPFSWTRIVCAVRNARRPSLSSVNHFLPLLDEMPPFNKDSQIRDLPFTSVVK
jgi:hypothetical protein